MLGGDAQVMCSGVRGSPHLFDDLSRSFVRS